jgi:hypothetical protein
VNGHGAGSKRGLTSDAAGVTAEVVRPNITHAVPTLASTANIAKMTDGFRMVSPSGS